MFPRKSSWLLLGANAVGGTACILAAVLALARCGSSSHAVGASPPAASDAAAADATAASGAGDAGASDAPGMADDASGSSGDCGVPSAFAWSSTGPILAPVSNVTHQLVAIKDPSVVYYNGKWHVFVSTVDTTGSYSMAYIQFADWSQPDAGAFYYLDDNSGLAGYHAAPQVFYFAPQNKWYLIYQSGPPQYSTNADVGNPAGWSAPTSFFATEPDVVTQNQGATGGWLDFWVICDSANCYLFFSDDNGHWYRSQTAVADFPNGFANTVVVMQDTTPSRLFEASNVYLMKNTGKYLALVEAYDATSAYHRYFRSWTADALDGAWTPLEDTFTAPFASTHDVTFGGTPWTADISHGEMIRDGYDQTLEIDTCRLQYLYQGYSPSAPTNPYNGIPWNLALLTKTN
jgi:endo-1,4-beta-xylanase